MPEPGDPIYLVDTCVWVNVRDVDGDSEEIWGRLFLLIEAGRVKTVRQVMVELERRWPDVYARLKPFKRKLVVSDAITYTADVAAEVRAVHAQHPGLYDQLGLGNPADPWLVAIGKTQSAVVVTDERSTGKQYQRKIPYVCTQRNVGWINRPGFYAALGIVP